MNVLQVLQFNLQRFLDKLFRIEGVHFIHLPSPNVYLIIPSHMRKIKKLVRSKQRFRQGSRFEQCKAQQHRIAHAGPDGGGHIPTNADILHQHRINAYAHHDEKRLEAQGEQRFQVVLPGAAPFPVGHGS